MDTKNAPATLDNFLPFDRTFLSSVNDFTVIGDGAIGGKAHGLAFVRQILDQEGLAEKYPGLQLTIPKLTVITTNYFESFMADNRLYDFLAEEHEDARIAHEFQKADLPPMLVGDLWALIRETAQPLAVRSSSLLEDALRRPFAGIYETKMIPNNQPEIQQRFQRLTEAIKFVYASTFFQAAREYRRSTGLTDREEKMAVIIQEVVGERYGDRFYPTVSGVCRSFTYYSFGGASPEDGVVNLALGLGKTIVDGGLSWVYCPRFPQRNPPYTGIRQMLSETQKDFWAVNMGPAPVHDPVDEKDFLSLCPLSDAEYDDTLKWTASTYNVADDRLDMGVGESGPRVLTFAPILVGRELPLADLVSDLLAICKDKVGADVEIEFAMTLPREGMARFGFLQVRPMVVSQETVSVTDEEIHGDRVLLYSDKVLGNGVQDKLRHIVYLKPDTFSMAATRTVAGELTEVNRALVDTGRHYLLVGFGRWGSADPWLGIPITWGRIGGARAIVEAMLEGMNVDLSEGSHFFQNLNAFQVSYFSVPDPESRIDWRWLDSQPTVIDKAHVRCVELPRCLEIRVDGRSGRGVILK